jgi:hypothetical protein
MSYQYPKAFVTKPEMVMTENTAHGSGQRMSRWRLAAWGVAALFLLMNAVMMQFTDAINWTVVDFVFAGVLLFGSLGVYEIATRTRSSTRYRAGIGLATGATVLLIWGNAAVGVTDSAADGLYFGTAALAIIGIIIALFRPGWGARAMFAVAFTLVLASGTSLVAGMVPNGTSSLFEILGITGFYVALFLGSAMLLRT